MKSGLGTSLLTIILALSAYSLIFPRPLGQDLFFRPLGVSEVLPVLEGAAGPQSTFFRLGDRFGSYDAQGKVEFSRGLYPHLSVSQSNLSWSDAPSGGITTLGTDGSSSVIPSGTYSHWIGDRLYLIDENRMGLSEFQKDGILRWKKEFSSLLTALDAGINLTLVGSADGRVQAFDKAGRTKLEYTPGGSRIPVVYNLAVSPGETHMAIVSGLDPKRFVLMSKTRDEYRPVYHRIMADTRKTATAVGFLGQGDWAYFADDKQVVLVNTRTMEEKILTVSGEIDSAWSLNDLGLTALMSTQEGRIQVEYLTSRGLKAAGFALQGLEAFVHDKGDRIFLGSGNRILSFERVLQ